jgi:uncharacterized protein YeaC (DUF1315 family)
MRLVSLYELLDPRDGRVRYVGQTAYLLTHRLNAHLVEARSSKGHNPKNRWVRKLDRLGLRPIIHPVVLAEPEEVDEIEVAVIRSLRLHGVKMLNTTEGGRCPRGHKLTAEHREKSLAALRSFWARPGAREEHSEKMRRAMTDPVTRAKIAEAARVRRLSAESCARISASLTGRTLSPETRVRMSAAAVRRVATPESRQRISATLKKYFSARKGQT